MVSPFVVLLRDNGRLWVCDVVMIWLYIILHAFLYIHVIFLLLYCWGCVPLAFHTMNALHVGPTPPILYLTRRDSNVTMNFNSDETKRLLLLARVSLASHDLVSEIDEVPMNDSMLNVYGTIWFGNMDYYCQLFRECVEGILAYVAGLKVSCIMRWCESTDRLGPQSRRPACQRPPIVMSFNKFWMEDMTSSSV